MVSGTYLNIPGLCRRRCLTLITKSIQIAVICTPRVAIFFRACIIHIKRFGDQFEDSDSLSLNPSIPLPHIRHVGESVVGVVFVIDLRDVPVTLPNAPLASQQKIYLHSLFLPAKTHKCLKPARNDSYPNSSEDAFNYTEKRTLNFSRCVGKFFFSYLQH